ncbi:MAG: hypothetical protein AAB567_03600 [Patescibacteria group bacterium]
MTLKTMRHLNFQRLAIFSLFVSALFIGFVVFAENKDDIVYPVKELGNCESEVECRAYCEELDRIKECVAFAEKHNLLSSEELAEARKFIEIGGEGPGKCAWKKACETYCEDVAHIDECLAFAQKHNLMSGEELEEAQRVAAALREGIQLPGDCKSKAQCETYCEDTSHMEECIEFAEKAGFLPPEELQEARNVVRALQSGAKLPGNCRGKDQCQAYCQEPAHMEECIAFAEAAGFIPPEEAAMARKVMPLMMRGEMPGGCKSKEECESYCQDESHMEECVIFAQKAGLMSDEEVEMFRKTGGKGPGDCKGKEECETFCNNPANQEACFEFAQEHGLIREEDLEHMKEGLMQLKEGLDMAPPEVADCLRSTVDSEILEKIEAGTFLPNPELGEAMRQCFEKFMPPPFEGEHPEGFGPPRAGFGGPGGCKSEEECIAYCSDPVHLQECEQFGGKEPRHEEGFQGGKFPEEFREKFEERFHKEVEQKIGPGVTGEKEECVQRIIGGLQGPPGPDLEQRIRQECFMLSPGEQQFIPPKGFVPPPPGGFTPPQEFHPEQFPSSQSPTSFEQKRSVLDAFSPFLAVLLLVL